MHANPEENVAMVDELVLCQEEQPQIHHSLCPLALSAVICCYASLLQSELEETY